MGAGGGGEAPPSLSQVFFFFFFFRHSVDCFAIVIELVAFYCKQ